ncbi:hypothetical protein AVEN_54578-1 [Araneus ventricosus]|uniref:Uncharacterized protein n=1 Tax=Araneus ventricosus TaxID=182803 RepID=A0A4Y2BKZ0_ARAVE|nr:hypothetical protein AVEN_54578-1 [Araneus ventricosus]
MNWCGKNQATAFEKQNPVSRVKHGRGGVIAWGVWQTMARYCEENKIAFEPEKVSFKEATKHPDTSLSLDIGSKSEESSNSDEVYETLEDECYNSELSRTFEDTQRSKEKEQWDIAKREELKMTETLKCSSDKSIPVLRFNSFSGGFSDEFHNSLNCLRVLRKFNKVLAVHWNIVLYHLQKFMRTDMSENCKRCDITSLPVNEIYVVCSSNVNSRSNESTNTITIFANFPCLDNSPSCKGSNMASLIS